jgi:3-oxocholest-4-en-26-oyl-CoA dehydrogenase alpha subunit
VDFSLSDDMLRLREVVREVVAANLTDDDIAETHRTGTNMNRGLYKALGERGLLANAMPGAKNGDPMELWVIMNELEILGAPVDALGMALSIAAVVERLGTEEQQRKVVPGILAGETLVCFGFTEPDGGSDLPAIKTRAVQDGDGWVINGAKMWTTMAHVADWILLLARSDPSAGRYGGFTTFLIPMDTPGITVDPVWTMSTERSNATFYDDVRVGPEAVLGTAHEGWATMRVMLSFERGLGNTNGGVGLLRHFAEWAQETGLIDDPIVRDQMAITAIENEVSKLLTQRTVWLASTGALPGVEGSIAKVFATESYQHRSRALQAAAGPYGLLGLHQPGAAGGGWVDHDVRHSTPQTLQGGTSEINRNNIAERHLGLPRGR